MVGIFEPFFRQFSIFIPVIDYINNFHWVTGVTPLSSPWVAWGVPFVYLLMLSVIKKLLEKRKGFDLRLAVACHNGFLGVLSLVMLIGIINSIVWRSLTTSFWESWCMPGRSHTTGDGCFWEYVFYVSKYYELLDSVFLALRKKPLTFLHVYHHFIVIPLFWAYNSTYTFGHWMLIVPNTAVHVFMYYYYTIATYGYKVWWKKYLTIAQISQFLVDLSVTWPFYPLQYFYGTNCSTEMWTLHFGQLIGITFAYLFYQLYKEAYLNNNNNNDPKKIGEEPQQQQQGENHLKNTKQPIRKEKKEQ